MEQTKAKNYGPYASDVVDGDLPLDFLADLDITGGNSGLKEVLRDIKKSIRYEDLESTKRRLLNWAMLNVANSLMDLSFDATKVQIIERNYNGFSDVAYNADLELWGATATMGVSFENFR